MLQRESIMSSEDFQKDNAYKTPSGKILNKLARNPHLNVDVVHSTAASESAGHTVQYQVDVPALANGQSDFVDAVMALDASKPYSFSISGYAAYPLVQTSANRQDSTTVRVVVENQSGDIVPATTILITATSL